MKLLVFEFITGGGLAGQDLPPSLLAEGRMMLQALLNQLKVLPDIEVVVLLDTRCLNIPVADGVQIVAVAQQTAISEILPNLVAQVDAVWPIAPETAGILHDLACIVQSAQKILLLSQPETVAVCADKWQTYQALKAGGLPVVETFKLSQASDFAQWPGIVKPVDGVGCEGNQILAAESALASLICEVDTADYLLQPCLMGDAISLSCLFKQGQAWLLTVNRQQLQMYPVKTASYTAQRFALQACWVNVAHPERSRYLGMIAQIAMTLPGLWGYVGIDLLENPVQGSLILEINPRLTTSFVGIYQATGINVAAQVLNLLSGQPDLTHRHAQTVPVIIQQ